MTPKDYAALLHMALSMYDSGARGTGRTKRMLEQCQDGGVVVCPTSRVAVHTRRMAIEMNKDITTIVNDCNLSRLLERVGSVDRMQFEHTWLEEYFRKEIASLARCLTELQTEHNAKAGVKRDLAYTFVPVDSTKRGDYPFASGGLTNCDMHDDESN